jgi:hypothetical protein
VFPTIMLENLAHEVYSMPTPDGSQTIWYWPDCAMMWPEIEDLAWLEREQWAGEVFLDDEAGTAARSYGLSSYPFLVFLDADGKVVARTSGEVPAADIAALADAAR